MLADGRAGDGHRPLVYRRRVQTETARVRSGHGHQGIEHESPSSATELNRHNYLYYVEAKPEISDREYDRMMNRLTELEAEHPELVTSGQPHPAGRRPAAGRLRDRPARGPDAVDRQHLFVRRASRVGRARPQGT